MSLSEKRSIEREQLYAEERVCGVTFGGLNAASYAMIQNPSFWPEAYRERFTFEELMRSEMTVMLVDLTTFACLNMLRRKNGLEPLTDLHPLAQLADQADG